MANSQDGRSGPSTVATSVPPEVVTSEAKPGTRAVGAPAKQAAHTDEPEAAPPTPPAAQAPSHPLRKWLLLSAGIVVALALGAYFLVPWVVTALHTVSTDDAYVNGHVTFVAPQVAGRVTKVLVDDNKRVKTGDLLVQLDKEPYQVQVNINKAAVAAAETDLAAAESNVRGLVAQTRSNRFKLERAIEAVDNQISLLRANVAALQNKKASLARAKADYERAIELAKTRGAIAPQDVDQKREAFLVAQAQVNQAFETVYQVRVGLGLPAKPDKGDDLAQVPPDLDQNYSSVREALSNALQSAAQFGYFPTSWDKTPKQAITDFYKQEAQGDLNHVYDRLVRQAPTVKQAEAKILQARDALAQAELNLRYCDIVSDTDGQVTSRNVNPGNFVQIGQSLMAVRSVTEIWIDANFKETQLADLRIGQRVRCEVQMYGKRGTFEGRVTGFTMGTGQTLALLPPQNATGNFVKIVQRLPVRIELTDYEPEKAPLFVGLSVTPYVYFKEPPTGAHAGDILQPYAPLPQRPTDPKP
jgi:membrane fusion protein (multidrug efflux system)